MQTLLMLAHRGLPRELWSRNTIVSLFLVAFASYASLFLVTLAGSPWAVRASGDFASWIVATDAFPEVSQRSNGQWMGPGTMPAITAGTESDPGRYLAWHARETLGLTGSADIDAEIFGLTGVRPPLPWLWIALGVTCVWSGVLVQGSESMRRMRTPMRRRLVAESLPMLAVLSLACIPIPGIVKLLRVFWSQVPQPGGLIVNSFGAGRFGLACIYLGAVIAVASIAFAGFVRTRPRLLCLAGMCSRCGYQVDDIRRCPECGAAGDSPASGGRKMFVASALAAVTAVLVLWCSPIWLSWLSAMS